ncbi:MAG: zf-HC2 domain-containing protein [Spirochaetes bacterium]|nr:zf-HC2 domain-containing protein [Spirochaetota bacterium]MBU0956098.1 zf-HC2 domain-containing protein [Spirochaetota bacterium]
MVCPNPELLSAWLDNEVPSPWKDAVQQHVQACPHCAAVVDRFSACHEALALQNCDDTILQSAADRVYGRLIANVKPASSSLHAFSRRLLVPLPLAAAAAALIIFLGASLFLAGRRNDQLMMAVQEAEQGSQVAAGSAIGMDAILEYLSSQGNGLNITISLPQSSGFSGSGEPFIVREADFKPTGGNK